MIMNNTLIQMIFIVNTIVISILLATVVWSVIRPGHRVWPPPRRGSWQYALTWIGWSAAIALNACLLFLDWNSWIPGGDLRFLLGLSIIANSQLLWITHALLTLWFIIAPLSEEVFLETRLLRPARSAQR